MKKKILVVQVAALGWELLKETPELVGLHFKPMDTVFPGVTCPVQATMRTGLPPSQHGMVFNGTYSRQLRKSAFWEQSCKLVDGERIWKDFRAAGNTVGMLFWQQSLGEEVDVLLSPWPVHKHHGGLIDLTHSKPDGLYDEICKRINKKFRLMHYWGPMASVKAGDWIAEATAEVMQMSVAPDLLFTYLPHLDYDYQKYPANHPRCRESLAAFRSQLETLSAAAKMGGYEIMIYGDYAIGEATQVVYPNRTLRDAGLMKTRNVNRMVYPNLFESTAFAVVDHEMAHIYIDDPDRIEEVREVLAGMGSGFDILDREAQAEYGIDHPNSGELILVGSTGTWFAYPWWSDSREQPDYATHIDIHNKPGYDPCELFSGWNPFKVSTDTSLVQGTHGAPGPARKVAWASSFEFDEEPDNIVDLALALQRILANVESP